ncbi:MAG: hypothetical protein Q3965_05580 [Rothia sp. (in: high G+C Gram-positive bacteria)]|nr:hypothetical protein [Rothia sp. (in: high G+C Gram-positive bacteria)]
MKFENWVKATFVSPTLNDVATRRSSPQELNKMHKALHMADSMLGQETVAAIAFGRFSGFGDSLLVLTDERLLIVKNSFQSGLFISLRRNELSEVRLSQVPLLGHALTLQGGSYRFSRISAGSAADIRTVLSVEQKQSLMTRAA